METTDPSDVSISRRRMLALGGAGLLGLGAGPSDTGTRRPAIGGWSNSSPSGQAAGTDRMHLSMAAYSMREPLENGEMSLFEFVDWCGELGLAGTELTSYYFPEEVTTDYLHRLKRRAWRSGLTVTGTAVGNDFCLPPGTERREQIDHVRRWIDYAAEMYAPHIRIFAGSAPEGVERETAIGWVVASIREVLTYAAERGVMLGLENHGGVTARAESHLEICDRVGEDPWFGINLDTGNYRTNVYRELEMAAPAAVNVQYKVEVHRDGTSKPADVERIRDILVGAEYRGWIALEYEADEDPRAAIPRHVQTLRRAFG